MTAKFWVYFKAPGLSTVPDESSWFSLCFLPKNSQLLVPGGNTLILSYPEEMPMIGMEEDQDGLTQTR